MSISLFNNIVQSFNNVLSSWNRPSVKMTWTLKIRIIFLVQIYIFDLQQPSVTFLKKKKNRKYYGSTDKYK